ncbi:hypothetical protein [Magnetospirillum molischianum]|uniref:hypothetical protein n=1 Tax=Magnetospirillum molischianum TaxID=1083 RepID=UPI0002EB184D|nr:hypothetical protein [Magnetospirillum molischianum]
MIVLQSDRVPVSPLPGLDSSLRPNPILVPPSVLLRATGNPVGHPTAPSVVVVTKEAPSPFLGPAESAADRAIDRNQNALLLEKLRKENRFVDHDRPAVMVVPLFDRSQAYAGSAADAEIDRIQRTQFIDRYLYRY